MRQSLSAGLREGIVGRILKPESNILKSLCLSPTKQPLSLCEAHLNKISLSPAHFSWLEG